MEPTLTDSFFGLHKTTLLDYPGEVAATLFIPGCNLRCPFCHNPEMVLPEQDTTQLFSWEAVQQFILSRKKLIGGICLTGGEPLLYPYTGEIVAFIKAQGLKVKIDTNGTLPAGLKALAADYIAMDVKTAFPKYTLLGGKAVQPEKLQESINWILASGIDHEFRTTVVPGIVELQDIRELLLRIKGARRYILAQYRPMVTLDPAYREVLPYPLTVLEEMQAISEEAGIPCRIRAGYNNG